MAKRYISKKEREDAVLEAAQKEAEAREVYLKSQISGERMLTFIFIIYTLVILFIHANQFKAKKSFMDLPPRLNKILHNPQNEYKKSVIPKKLSVSFQGHTAGVNCVRWSRPYPPNNSFILFSLSLLFPPPFFVSLFVILLIVISFII